MYGKEYEQNTFPWYAPEYRGPVNRNQLVPDYLSLTPREIKAELEKSVIGQEEACRQMAIMMYQHLHGHRFVGLLAGPTGSGKSFLAENLEKLFPDVVYLRDVSNVTNEGWSGSKKVASLFRDVHNPYSYIGRIYPLIVLDECDKLFAPRINSGGENVSESIQSEFLSVIHGSDVEIKTESGKIQTINTRPMSFLFAGAFEKRARLIAEKESDSAFGFGAYTKNLQSYHRDLTMEDIAEAGCITELCGRIQKIVCLKEPEEGEFRRMLDIRGRGPVFELENEFNIRFELSEDKKDEMAHEAFESGLGIRGIKNRLRNYIDEAIWEDHTVHTIEVA